MGSDSQPFGQEGRIGLAPKFKHARIATQSIDAHSLKEGCVGKALLCRQERDILLAGSLKKVTDINCRDSARKVLIKLAESSFSSDFYSNPEPRGIPISDCFWMAVQGGMVYIATTSDTLNSIDVPTVEKILGMKIEILITQPPRMVGKVFS